MSIFKDTFKPEIARQLEARQKAIFERTPDAIQYFNARNAWVRMSSAVNVKEGPDQEPTNTLASQYILQGGTLYPNNTVRSGVGVEGQAYSLLSPGNKYNRLGMRPMPGITNIEVKSKSAYGSLKEVTVNFNAWDIKQLEDLELLYMRPGYTVLVEWGWAPYLGNDEKLKTFVDFYDIINKTPTKEQIFKDLYDTAVKKYNGNYDALFGYVKNYSWAAREDGGYDCTTTIISVGEIMESLKVNYSPLNNIDQVIGNGGLLQSGADEDDLKDQYSKNILAGLFYELWYLGKEKGDETAFDIEDKGKNTKYHAFRKKINIHGGVGESNSEGDVGASDVQVYITLESLSSLINNYVIFKDSNSNSAYVTCSVFDREYDKSSPNTPDPNTGEGGYLLCLGHPLQISMDPSVCLINSPTWADGTIPSPDVVKELNSPADTNVVRYTNTNVSVYNKLIEYIKKEIEATFTDEEALIKELSSKLNGDANEVKELSRIWHARGGKNLYGYLDKGLTSGEIERAVGKNNVDFLRKDPSIVEKEKLEEKKKEAVKQQEKTIKEASSSSYLKKLNPYFYKNDPTTEIGIIGNIYVNVNFLYRLSLDNNLQSTDTKEKNDINLYDFLKRILSEISSAIGRVNNFDLHVDPIDSVIRMVDINYVDTQSRKDVFKNLFQLEMHNTKSTVRSYKLESQIFPDQSSIIAIGAQVGGGAMATDNNTMLDFNKGLEDRIIPKKIDPLTNPNKTNNTTEQLSNLASILDIFYGFFERLNTWWSFVEDSDYNTDKADSYKNALKDLINFYKNLTKSDVKNRSIIPTKLSITMDGIGGLVIGHMFKIPEELLPKGYKGETLGSKLGYTVTGIGHSVSNNDWTTNIDAQTIPLDDPSGEELKYSDLIKKEDKKSTTPTPNPEETEKKKSNIKAKTSQSAVVAKYGEPGDTSQLVTLNLPYTLYYGTAPINSIKVHRLAKDSLEQIFKEILATYGLEKIKTLRLNRYSGLYNARDKRCCPGEPSIHSWGIAIDLCASENAYKQKTGSALFSKPEYIPFINIWYKHGWKSFGRELNYDWMHFQVADAPF
jgi:hypothetical protein